MEVVMVVLKTSIIMSPSWHCCGWRWTKQKNPFFPNQKNPCFPHIFPNLGCFHSLSVSTFSLQICLQYRWRGLPMNALISERWDTDASIIEGDVGFELHAATKSILVVIVITRPQHELDRHDVKQVVCSVCDTEQSASMVCTNCGIRMGEYFCEICKFYDDDIDKGLFHCDDCGICRVGGRDRFFHCKKCGSCYSVSLRENHSCIEDSMRHHCSICYEFLFDSMKDTTVMKCGHTMHSECYYEMLKRDQYCCPICSKSVIDMSRTWKRIDEEIEATINFRNYQRKVWIVCKDCNDTTEVYFHTVGQKCSHCKSCNTSSIAPPVLPQ